MSGPAVEPCSLAEAKLFLRVDHTQEDALIEALVRSARTTVEALTGRALITRRVIESRDAWGGLGVSLALGPLVTLHAVRVAQSGAWVEANSATILTDAEAHPPRLRFTQFPPAPTRALGGIELEYSAGYGESAAAIPAPLRQAVLVLTAQLYADREGADSAGDVVHGLVAPYARVRL